METFRIASTGHSPTYLPEYLAGDLGFFEDEGLSVVATAPDPWPRVLDDLDSGRADAVLGGAWLPAIYHNRVNEYKIFAQINGRYPLALLSRKPADPDDLSWLEDRVVLVPSSGGSAAYMFFTGLLRERGVDLSRIQFLRDLSHEIFAKLFAGGLGDAMVTYMVNARQLIDSGHATLAASLDDIGGPMPNSVYYTSEDVLARPSQPAMRFARAIQRAIDWISTNGVEGETVRRLLAREWPHDNPARLIQIVEGFHSSGLWSAGVRVDEDALARWQRLLVEGRLLTEPAPYDDLVDLGPAEFALAAH